MKFLWELKLQEKSWTPRIQWLERGTDLRRPFLACDPFPYTLSLPGSLGQTGAQSAQKAGKEVASRCHSFGCDRSQSVMVPKSRYFPSCAHLQMLLALQEVMVTAQYACHKLK